MARLARMDSGPDRSFRTPVSFSSSGYYTRRDNSRLYTGICVTLVILGASGSLISIFTAGPAVLASIPAVIGLLLGFLKFIARRTMRYSRERAAVYVATVTGLLGALGGLAGIVYSVMRFFGGSAGDWLLLATGIFTLGLCAAFCIIFIREEY